MQVSRVLSPGLGAGSVLSAAATLLGDFNGTSFPSLFPS